MEKIKRGDVLWGEKRKFEEAWHPIVYISGSLEAPLAVVLTHDNDFSCNIPLKRKYDGKQSYFVAHLIQKISDWGPYEKSDRLVLDKDDLKLIESHIKNQVSITWQEYTQLTDKKVCREHGTFTSSNLVDKAPTEGIL